MNPQGWTIHKFGGTSVADAKRISAALDIFLSADPGIPRRMAVVSAMGPVTDQLDEILEHYKSKPATGEKDLQRLLDQHLGVLKDLGLAGNKGLEASLRADFKQIQEILVGVSHGNFGAQTQDVVLGFGELWSARIIHGALETRAPKAGFIDARKMITVTEGDLGVDIQWEPSQKLWDEWARASDATACVATGFLAQTPDGRPTTLKRNGSDLSAAIFARLSRASHLTIWKDVDGVFSADPRKVPQARILPEVTFEEAAELAHFGAQVVHPKTLGVLAGLPVQVRVRNSIHPQRPGTQIVPKRQAQDSTPVTGFATFDDLSLLSIRGKGMLGVPGVAARMFTALKEVNVNVIMISQASSEQSVNAVIPTADGKKGHQALTKAFENDKANGRIQGVELAENCAILSAVGDQMAMKPGVTARFTTALARAGVNIKAIAQGPDERNISVVISQGDATKGLLSAHSALILGDQTLSVGLVGPGLIGATLLTQLAQGLETLRKRYHLEIQLLAVANSKQMILSDTNLLENDWKNLLQKGQPVNLQAMATHLKGPHLPHGAMIDCTASDDIAALHPQWLAQGLHVITPNKRGIGGPAARFESIERNALQYQRLYLFETTVGAGLPVLHTLQDLLHTGDRIIEIQGIFSGTLAYIFHELTQGRPFSEVVREAKEKGYTEPDPRDDLSGMDVARKVLILARQSGLRADLDQVEVENLVPPTLQTARSAADFMARLKEMDAPMKARLDQHKGQVLRYVGQVKDGKLSARLMAFPPGHTFSQAGGTDNLISFRTARYDKNPLIIRGPGAGPEVTAAGVFSDLLRLSSHLGAPL